jgi:hypothetical protein
LKPPRNYNFLRVVEFHGGFKIWRSGRSIGMPIQSMSHWFLTVTIITIKIKKTTQSHFLFQVSEMHLAQSSRGSLSNEENFKSFMSTSVDTCSIIRTKRLRQIAPSPNKLWEAFWNEHALAQLKIQWKSSSLKKR